MLIHILHVSKTCSFVRKGKNCGNDSFSWRRSQSILIEMSRCNQLVLFRKKIFQKDNFYIVSPQTVFFHSYRNAYFNACSESLVYVPYHTLAPLSVTIKSVYFACICINLLNIKQFTCILWLRSGWCRTEEDPDLRNVILTLRMVCLISFQCSPET